MHVKANGKLKSQQTMQTLPSPGVNFEDDITNGELCP